MKHIKIYKLDFANYPDGALRHALVFIEYFRDIRHQLRQVEPDVSATFDDIYVNRVRPGLNLETDSRVAAE